MKRATNRISEYSGSAFLSFPDIELFRDLALYPPLAALRDEYLQHDKRRKAIRRELEGLEGRERAARREDVDRAVDTVRAGGSPAYDKIGPSMDAVQQRRVALRAEAEVVNAAIVRVGGDLDQLLNEHADDWLAEIETRERDEVVIRGACFAAYQVAHELVARHRGMSRWLGSRGQAKPDPFLTAETSLQNGAPHGRHTIGHVLAALAEWEEKDVNPREEKSPGMDADTKAWSDQMRWLLNAEAEGRRG